MHAQKMLICRRDIAKVVRPFFGSYTGMYGLNKFMLVAAEKDSLFWGIFLVEYIFENRKW